MKRIPTDLPDVVVLEPKVYGDHRGEFFEAFHASRYAELGLPERFVQLNVSRSVAGVLRGLHFQQPQAQGKLVLALDGAIYDVAVDIRAGSPYYRRHVAVELSGRNRRALYVPPGFAHGFAVLEGPVTVAYLCTAEYAASADRVIRWNDPDLAIAWPLADPILSDKDRSAPLLSELPSEARPP